MKKKLCLILTVLLTVTMFVGCNKEERVQEGKTKLLIGLPGGDAVTDMRVVDDFIAARSDKYVIETDESAWGDFNKKVKLQMMAKNEITPVFFTDSAMAMAFGEQGALVDLDSYVKEDLDEALYTKALRAVTNLDGKLWGVPHAMNSVAIIYNKDIFDERGVAYPTEDWTFEDMLNLAEKLTFDRDGDGKTDVYGIYYLTNITQGWWPFLSAYGVSPLKDDFRNSNLDDPKVLDAFDAYRRPHLAGHVPSGAEVAASGSIEAFFTEGKVAMYIGQSSALAPINKFNPDMNYDVQIMPIGWSGERTCIYVPNVWVIADGAKDDEKAAAWDWISYYLSEESQMKVAETTPSGYPIMKAALDAVSNNGLKPENKDAFYRGIDEFGTTILENACSAEMNSAVGKICGKVATGEDLETTVAEAHKELQDALDYFYEQAE